MNLILKKAVENKIFSVKPFQRPFSREFIKAAKEGSIQKIEEYLLTDRYLVYEYDQVNKKKLKIHRNFSQIKLLCIGHRKEAMKRS